MSIASRTMRRSAGPLVHRLSRRRVVAASSIALASIAFVRTPARPAQFVFKYGNVLTADDPWNVRAVQMTADIKRDTGGRLEIQVYPNSILGGDAALLQQVRLGVIQFLCFGGASIGSFAPTAPIQSVPYAFPTMKAAVAAHVGELGAVIRKEIEGSTGLHVFPTILAGSFRQITSSTKPIRNASDLSGFKIRTINAGTLVEFYKTFGAQVITLSVGEVYTALQTHLADGQDSGFTVIETQRLYEVQKYLSIMNAIWTGGYFLCNGDAWRALPPDIQEVVTKHASVYGQRVARDIISTEAVLVDKLRRQGMSVYPTDRDSFKSRLGPFYAKLKATYGSSAWALLEEYGGPLA